mmetsp:Transcript_12465/g.36555  ORF Transcript_12465/g.36555 Transcript_12465/m.36555 type:complete len:252 (+) Transcript_12465:151-906(+)
MRSWRSSSDRSSVVMGVDARSCTASSRSLSSFRARRRSRSRSFSSAEMDASNLETRSRQASVSDWAPSATPLNLNSRRSSSACVSAASRNSLCAASCLSSSRATSSSSLAVFARSTSRALSLRSASRRAAPSSDSRRSVASPTTDCDRRRVCFDCLTSEGNSSKRNAVSDTHISPRSSCLWSHSVSWKTRMALVRERLTLEKVLSLSCSVVEHGSTRSHSLSRTQKAGSVGSGSGRDSVMRPNKSSDEKFS